MNEEGSESSHMIRTVAVLNFQTLKCMVIHTGLSTDGIRLPTFHMYLMEAILCYIFFKKILQNLCGFLNLFNLILCGLV